MKILLQYFDTKIQPGISSTAIISKKAEIHNSVYIGDYSYVGECKIGEGTIVQIYYA